MDGQELNLEKEFYDYYPTNSNLIPYSIDYGGSQTFDLIDDGTDACRSTYACGIVVYQSNEYDQAKMYFSDIPVDNCNLQNEFVTLNSFLELNDYTYDQYIDFNDTLINTVALDYFPANSTPFDYYSSRFGDNSDADFQIISVTEESIGIYIVEGTFTCKLYSFEDTSFFKQLDNGEFKIIIRKNLEE